MITIEEIITAHLAVRSAAEWNALADAVEAVDFDGDQPHREAHNDAYRAVAVSLGLNDVGYGSAIANFGGHDVFAEAGEIDRYEARDFEAVMDSYRRAIADALNDLPE